MMQGEHQLQGGGQSGVCYDSHDLQGSINGNNGRKAILNFS